MPRGKTTTKECPLCSKHVSLFAFNRHVKSHHGVFSTLTPFTEGRCKYCDKHYTNKSGLSNHERRCSDNPNRVIETLSDAGRGIISAASIRSNKQRWSDAEYVSKFRDSMRSAVNENPDSYTSANRGRTKQYIVDGIKLQGKWEVDFYTWARDSGLQPKRPSKGFSYVWHGKRTYYPDFYLPTLDAYVEVKGYETDRDRAKWGQFPETLLIIRNSQIRQVRNGKLTIDLLQETKYNK